jgi:hypothetical protein
MLLPMEKKADSGSRVAGSIPAGKTTGMGYAIQQHAEQKAIAVMDASGMLAQIADKKKKRAAKKAK